MKKLLYKLSIVLLLVALFPVAPVVKADDYSRTNPAPGYDPNNLITDSQFTAFGMTDGQVADFLNQKGSWLKNYVIPNSQSVFYQYRNPSTGNCDSGYVDVPQVYNEGGNNENFGGLQASALIAQQSHKYNINPQVILATLEKESSAITRTTERNAINTAWILGVGWNDTMASCGYTQAQAQNMAMEWGGIGQQIAYANHFVLRSWFNYQQANPSNTPSVKWSFTDNTSFNLQTSSFGTKALYRYTPYVYMGNYNFWYLMGVWFLNFAIPFHPDLAQAAGDPVVYAVVSGKRYPIDTADAFNALRLNWSDIHAMTGEQAALPIGAPIKRLVNGFGKVFYIENGTKRYIASPEIFNNLGFDWNAISRVDSLLDSIPDGLPMYELARPSNSYSIYIMSMNRGYAFPSMHILEDVWKLKESNVGVVAPYAFSPFPLDGQVGRTAQGHGSTVYLVDGGARLAIPTAPLFTAWGFSWGGIVHAEDTFLDRAVPVRSGSLTNLAQANTDTVYLIQNGQKQPFATAAAFTSRGYQWGNITHVTDDLLTTLPTGPPLR